MYSLILTLLIFTLLPLLTHSIQCYSCHDVLYVTGTISTFTAEKLESLLTASNCKTTLTSNVSRHFCATYLTISNTSSVPISTTGLFYSADSIETTSTDRTDTEIRLKFEANYTSTDAMSFYRMDYEYYCYTDKCNSVENMKRVLLGAPFSFHFEQFMQELHNPAAGPLRQVSSYVTGPPTYCGTSTSCTFPPPSNESNCIQARAITCQHQMCGGCSSLVNQTSNTLGYFHHVEFLTVENRSLTSLFYTYLCDIDNCNSEEKQKLIRSMSFSFDFNKFEDNGNGSAGLVRASYVGLVSLLLCLIFH
ncbi:hypothetical protein I4U23_011244 [Adineta vaga]|nr:hypothetical protein I4U23_011244 [Adineta vaga]